MTRTVFLSLLILFCAACAVDPARMNQQRGETRTMNQIAEDYIRLTLAMGEHDSDYVDAYYGPPEWREEVRANTPTVAMIRTRSAELRNELARQPRPDTEMLRLRLAYLQRQLQAMDARAAMLQGERLSFDEESKALYDAVAPRLTAAHFDAILQRLERELPGEGSLASRLEAFRSQYVIPRERLDTVFRAAVDGCRERTARFIDLPEGESFTIEYVTGKSWSGYNWYQGGYRSLIQVNVDLPIFADRAIDLACHEGYPGHHVFNVLLEKNLVRDRGWLEFSVYPLFSPHSLIAEGTGNYGIEVAFSRDERLAFEREVIFPLAGLDPSTVERYYRVQDLTGQLAYAGNEAARGYLDGELTAAQAQEWLVRYAMMEPARAAQRIRFFDQYRSYVINYNLGKDMVRTYVERQAVDDSPEARWRVFAELISSPRLPSNLIE